MNSDLMVSIYCRTYNHRTYIRDALDSMLTQDTDFRYEIVIFDDASTDGTSDIVREYAEKNPQIIQAHIMKKNTFHNPQRAEIDSVFMKKYLTGKYIAHCEGDDFWIDNHKLQMQVDYMESHPECSLYLSNAVWYDCQNNTLKAGNPYQCKTEKDVSPEEIFMMYNGHPPTASILHRRDLVNMPQFFWESSVGDYCFLLYALVCGDIHYNNRIMVVYRMMAIGSYSTRRQSDKHLWFYFYFGLVDFLAKYNNYTKYRYEIWCNKKIYDFAFPLIHHRKWNLNIDESIKDCIERGYFFPNDFSKCANELGRIRKQIYDKTFVSLELKYFVNRYEHIVIMGAGNYAAILAEQFSYNHITYHGFAVSQKKENEELYFGKPIWNLFSLPYDKEKTGVVIGINPVDWNDIKNSLACAKIVNYYCPFLFSLED